MVVANRAIGRSDRFQRRLSSQGGREMAGTSRVNREVYARFCGRLEVKFLRPTRRNWNPTAKAYGLFVAVPDVGAANAVSQGCWDYDAAADAHHSVRDIVDLAMALKTRFPDIDPNQVYVTGLSSGAALALDIACKAPDVFAGVGAIAGPSVGSIQNNAFNNPSTGNVDHALARCKELAGVNAEKFSTQIASVAFGDLDKNGGGTPPIPRPSQGKGVTALVPVEWTKDNSLVLSRLFQPCSFGGAHLVADG